MPNTERRTPVRSKPENVRGHALVIGASMAGLFAGRVLSDYFERVTLLERDPVEDRPMARKGQPQTRHLHALLAQGLHLIQGFFPGIEQTLVEGGATRGDMGRDMRWYHFGGYKVQFESGLVGMLMSRPFLEWHVRRRVLALPNVALRDACSVGALKTSDDRARVVGVEATDRTGARRTETLPADLVVDATGRGSATPQWLAGLGYEKPPERAVKVRVGYATRLYRRRPGDLEDAELVVIFPTPPGGKRLVALVPVEDDRWIVTAGGWSGDYPPDDEEGYLAFIRSLPAPDVYDIVSRAEPLSDITSHRFPASLRHGYETLERFPEGYLVLGDAIASFNPIYGQGMTSAAMQAQALDGLLRERPGSVGLWRPWFERAAKVVDIPWQLAVGEDFRYPETEGEKPPLTGFVNAYVKRVHKATHHDPVVYARFLQVMNLLAPPTSLMAPHIAWRVLRRPSSRHIQQERGEGAMASHGA